MLTTFVFLLTLLAPVFGAQIDVPVRVSADDPTVAREACWKARRAAQAVVHDEGVKARIGECVEEAK